MLVYPLGVLGISSAVFSVLLVVTGVAKLRRPEETAKAMGALGFPSHRAIGWLIGLAELVVGLSALVWPTTLSLGLQAVFYGAFTFWVIVALARDVPLASCGCLGRDDTPPYWGHLALDVTATLVSVGAMLGPHGHDFTSALQTATAALLVTAGALLGWALIDQGARVYGAMRR